MVFKQPFHFSASSRFLPHTHLQRFWAAVFILYFKASSTLAGTEDGAEATPAASATEAAAAAAGGAIAMRLLLAACRRRRRTTGASRIAGGGDGGRSGSRPLLPSRLKSLDRAESPAAFGGRAGRRAAGPTLITPPPPPLF